MNLDTLFTQTSNPLPLAPEVEAAHVAAVADHGSTRSFLALAEVYAPRLRAASGRSRLAITDTDERRQSVLLAFHAAILATKPGARVATVVNFAMTDYLAKAASEARSGLSVPHGTAKRYFAILAAAGGDRAAALELAPSRGMTRAVFQAVTEAVSGGLSTEAFAEGDPDDRGLNGGPAMADAASPALSVERAMLARQALAAIEGNEKEVVLLAYGFTEPEPVSDAEIAHRLGVNRTSAWKIRMRALAKMRAALGA